MIQGTLGSDDELFFEIEFITAEGLSLATDALLDTGFSSWLAIDRQDASELGWVYLQERTMRTAKGDTVFEIYRGQVRLDRQEFEIPVHVGDGLSECLLGRRWLKTRRLLVDLATYTLTLG